MNALNSSIGGGGSEPISEARMKVLEHFCRFLKSWRRKTRGERVWCQRHHLKNDLLSQFEDDDVMLAIALAAHEREQGSLLLPVCELERQMRENLIGKSILDVIYEFQGIEKHLEIALKKWKALRLGGGGGLVNVWLQPDGDTLLVSTPAEGEEEMKECA